MSLIEAVESVANEAGYSLPDTIIGSSDTGAKQILAIANRVIEIMSESYEWTKLYRSASITLVSGQATYELPGDFSSYHYDTFWNQSQRYRVLGPLSPQEYAALQGLELTGGIVQRFQIRGITDNRITIWPTPEASGDVIIFEYISDRYVRPQTWSSSTTFAADAYCFYNGNYYQTTTGGSGGSAPTHTSGTTGIWTYYSGSYDKFLADTDEPILSQRVLEQGMLERFADIHGLTTIQRTFEQDINMEYSKDIPGKVIRADGYTTGKIISGWGGVAYFGGSNG